MHTPIIFAVISMIETYNKMALYYKSSQNVGKLNKHCLK